MRTHHSRRSARELRSQVNLVHGHGQAPRRFAPERQFCSAEMKDPGMNVWKASGDTRQVVHYERVARNVYSQFHRSSARTEFEHAAITGRQDAHRCRQRGPMPPRHGSDANPAAAAGNGSGLPFRQSVRILESSTSKSLRRMFGGGDGRGMVEISLGPTVPVVPVQVQEHNDVDVGNVFDLRGWVPQPFRRQTVPQTGTFPLVKEIWDRSER